MVCGQHLQNQLIEDQKSGKDLNETQQKIVNADDDELDDVVPDSYGPLAPNNAGYCKFCFAVGELGAVVFGGATLYGLSTFTQLPSETARYAAVGVWVLLAIVIGYRGYFPVLGPKLGPIVEDLLGNLGIYVTATARKKDGVGPWEGETVTDGGTVAASIDDTSPPELNFDDIEDSDPEQFSNVEEYLDHEENEKERLKQQVEQTQDRLDDYKEMLKEERADKQELLDKKDEIEQTKQQKEQQLEKKESEVNDIQENVNQLKAVIEDNANWGVPLGSDRMPDPNDALPCFQPLHSEQFDYGSDFGGAFGGTWLHLRRVEVYMEKFQQTVEVSYGVSHPDDLTEIPDAREIPTNLDNTEIPEHEEFLKPDPRNLDTPIDFTHPGKKGYDPDQGHTVLFWNDLGKVREARKGVIADDETGFQMTPVIIAWDIDDNYVPPSYDIRGFESVQKMRSENDEMSRMIDQMRGKLHQQNRRMETLQNKLTVKEAEVSDLDTILDRTQDREQRAVKAARSKEQSQRVLEKGVEDLREEADQAERERDLAMENRRQEKLKRIKDSDDAHEMRTKAKHNRERQERIAKWVPEIRDVYSDVDWDTVDDPNQDFGETDAFEEFMQDNSLEGTAKKVQDLILKEKNEG